MSDLRLQPNQRAQPKNWNKGKRLNNGGDGARKPQRGSPVPREWKYTKSSSGFQNVLEEISTAVAATHGTPPTTVGEGTTKLREPETQ